MTSYDEAAASGHIDGWVRPSVADRAVAKLRKGFSVTRIAHELQCDADFVAAIRDRAERHGFLGVRFLRGEEALAS